MKFLILINDVHNISICTFHISRRFRVEFVTGDVHNTEFGDNDFPEDRCNDKHALPHGVKEI